MRKQAAHQMIALIVPGKLRTLKDVLLREDDKATALKLLKEIESDLALSAQLVRSIVEGSPRKDNEVVDSGDSLARGAQIKIATQKGRLN